MFIRCNSGSIPALPDIQGWHSTPSRASGNKHKLPIAYYGNNLCRFLGLINFYRRALPDAANKQAPLLALIRGAKKNDKRKIIWTAEYQQAFNILKNSLADAALLAHPSSNLPLVLMVEHVSVARKCVYRAVT
jgi:hypothetical protein